MTSRSFSALRELRYEELEVEVELVEEDPELEVELEEEDPELVLEVEVVAAAVGAAVAVASAVTVEVALDSRTAAELWADRPPAVVVMVMLSAVLAVCVAGSSVT